MKLLLIIPIIVLLILAFSKLRFDGVVFENNTFRPDIYLDQSKEELFDKYLQGYLNTINETVNTKDYQMLLNNTPGIVTFELNPDKKQVHKVVSEVNRYVSVSDSLTQKIIALDSVFSAFISEAEKLKIHTPDELRAFVLYYTTLQKNNQVLINKIKS